MIKLMAWFLDRNRRKEFRLDRKIERAASNNIIGSDAYASRFKAAYESIVTEAKNLYHKSSNNKLPSVPKFRILKVEDEDYMSPVAMRTKHNEPVVRLK